jgi:hypothetical protein
MASLSQLPDVVDLSFVAGDTFRIRIRVVDPNSAEPMPLTLYSFDAQIAKLSDRSRVADFDLVRDAQDPTSVILSLPPSETAKLPDLGTGSEFKGIWDLEVTFPKAPGQAAGDVRTVAKGDVLCVLDVTNSGVP